MNGCSDAEKVQLKEGSHIVLLGNNLGSRMMNFGHFETEMHTRYPDSTLFIRNMSDPGNTPVFRPHAARNSPWAFPGAEQFLEELPFIADSAQAFQAPSIGHFPTPR
ncbi:MAG: hypothetical protein U5K69_06665 [Balneolaceae bacterium]|nr:hypothetical protein [Balneolaceae bacterium]